MGEHRPSDLSRRDFVKKTLGVAAVAAASPSLARAQAPTSADLCCDVGPTPQDAAESAVARLYKSLSDEQKKTICFGFDDPKRSQVQNNWAIVKPTIDDMKSEQQELCREIFKGITSEDGFDRFTRQMDEDYGGFESYHVALFGEPGSDKPFEWVLTGRHVTVRADGNSVNGAAFGGPIFYGHASKSFNEGPDHTGNVWWYQGEQANAIFKTLDEAQRKQAMVEKADPDAPRSIELKGQGLGSTGLGIAGLDGQQKKMVATLLDKLLLPFRKADADEVRACLEAAGGVDNLRMTFYKEGDIGDDGVWDIWRLEGPAFSWYFHGSPHVHTWLNVARPA
jgi:hypothetical protein